LVGWFTHIFIKLSITVSLKDAPNGASFFVQITCEFFEFAFLR